MNHTLTSLLELASTPDGLQQIRVMVAELMGVVAITECPECYGTGRLGGEGDCWPCRCDKGRVTPYVIGPNYPADLNACAELRKGLTVKQERVYACNIAAMLNCGALLYRDCVDWYAEEQAFTLLDATPVQHCIAFILTKQPTKGAEQ